MKTKKSTHMIIHKLKIQSHANIKTLEQHNYIKDSFNNCTFCVSGATRDVILLLKTSENVHTCDKHIL